MKPTRPVVLTIAGSDSGGGAGVQADARTIHALGGFACMAITAVTAQNTRRVSTWQPVAPRLLGAQIDAVLGDLPVAAIKTGLLSGATAVHAIAKALAKYARVPLVVDPVIGSTSGARFLDPRGVRALMRELLPLATIVTPNWPEAEVLAGKRIRRLADATKVALLLAETHGCAVLLKGGHEPAAAAVCDCLATADGRIQLFSAPRITTRNTHGTGCVLSAAIATRLAYGANIPDAVEIAREFLLASLETNRRMNWGGAGPAFPG